MDRDVGSPELRVDVPEKPRQADGVDDEVDPSVCDFWRQRDASEDEVHDVLDADPHFRRVIGCVQRVRQQQEQRVIRTHQEEGNGAQLSELGRSGRRVAGDLEDEARSSRVGHIRHLALGLVVGGHAEQKRALFDGRCATTL